jgi:DNA-binding transcriptional MerR regulator
MDANFLDKTFYRIGEVSQFLQVEPYVIRFWEKEFKHIKPTRTASGHRLYRKKDVETLILIKELLYERRFTISGARKHLTKAKREETEPVDRLVEIKETLVEIQNLISR